MEFDTISEWEPPKSKADAYMYGDVVSYRGAIYVSTADTNTWTPGTFGWELFSVMAYNM